MSSLNGFVKLHRKMVEWGWYSDCVVKDVFIHILMVARYTPGQYMGYDMKAGQAVIGRKKMATELGFSEQQIRTALKKLESTGEITLKSTNKFTIATVENWEFYQCNDEGSNQQSTNNQPTINQQITNEQPTDNQRITTSKERKNIYIYNSESETKKQKPDRKIIPPTLDMVTSYCSERNNGISPQYFIDYYTARDWCIGKTKMKDWQAAVRTWENNSKERNKEPISVEVKKYDV